MRFLVLVGSLSLQLVGGSQEAHAATTILVTPLREALDSISSYVDTAVGDDQFSGVVLIEKDGKVLLQKAWGLADRSNRVPLSLNSQFRLGSMNKMFTAVATLQLVESGKLSLDDTIGKYLMEYPNKDIANKVTIRQLLTHTGGTGDIFGPEFMKNRLSLKTHDDYLKLYGNRGPEFLPGTRFSYSNYGMVLLGAVIEKVSGISYYDYVRQRIFLPAGMKATDSLPETELVPQRANGYTQDSGKWVSNTDTLPWRGTAAGGGYSTAGDLLLFAKALQSGKLISKTMLAEATREQSQGDGIGYGFMTKGPSIWQGYGHTGGAPGMSTAFRVIPQQGYVFVALSNFDTRIPQQVLSVIEAKLQQLK